MRIQPLVPSAQLGSQFFQFAIAFPLAELLLRFEQARGGPARTVVAARPTFPVPGHVPRRAQHDSMMLVVDRLQRGNDLNPASAR